MFTDKLIYWYLKHYISLNTRHDGKCQHRSLQTSILPILLSRVLSSNFEESVYNHQIKSSRVCNEHVQTRIKFALTNFDTANMVRIFTVWRLRSSGIWRRTVCRWYKYFGGLCSLHVQYVILYPVLKTEAWTCSETMMHVLKVRSVNNDVKTVVRSCEDVRCPSRCGNDQR
jgi:hypothetical protein